MVGTGISDPAVAHAIGSIQAGLEALHDRFDRSEKITMDRHDRSEAAILERLHQHDENSRSSIADLRGDTVLAINNVREEVAQHATRINTLEGDKNRRDGAFDLWRFLDNAIHKYTPWLVTAALGIIAYLK